MTRKKGGGRESGGNNLGASPAGNTASSRKLGDRGQPSGSARTSAAAYPAATAICDHERGLCNHWEMQDRIRELEARVAALERELEGLTDELAALEEPEGREEC